MEIREPEPCCCLAELVARQLHGAQGPVVGGEAGAANKAHVVQTGQCEARQRFRPWIKLQRS